MSHLIRAAALCASLAAAIPASGGTMSHPEPEKEAPVRWSLPQPDRTKAADGYRPLAGVEHVELFHATPDSGVYCHHPQIIHHRGTFFATWSNHRDGEDGPGQRVLYSTSRDGRSWRPWAECFASLGAMRKPEQAGRVLTANGLVAVAGAVYAIAEVHDKFDGPDAEATRRAAETRTGRRTRRGRFGWGRLARALRPDGSLGPVFWLVADPPEPIEGAPQFPHAHDPRFADAARQINALLADPLHMCAWDFRFHTNWTTAADGHQLCEPTCYRRPDGGVVKLSRDRGRSRRVYAAVSRDGNTFAPAVRTDIPDAPSKAVAGTLPDGRIYLIGNQAVGRDPLVLSLSRDGKVFDWAAAIRHGAPKVRHPGRAKGPGYQYPSALVVGDALWVIYSIGKEDVAVSRVPLSALPTRRE